ncbi:MAG: DUF6438 domain-containing protein [Sphingomonas sp.]|uniref:DUF6438 domain-containing protein n=1 Tax=Sphingomonas sp. TaxID=28214 RepID=UPI003F81BCC5
MRAAMVLAAFLIAAPAEQPVMIGMADETLAAHKLSGPEVVEVDRAQDAAMSAAWIDIVISPTGDVTDAHRSSFDNSSGDASGVLAAARQWKFRPFTYAGRPITATGRIRIQQRLKPIWAKPDAPFPAIDYDHLKIELTRSACFGSCPDYKVTIDGAGNVLFSTQEAPADPVSGVHRRFSAGRGVLVEGIHRTKIDRTTLDGLIAKFREARFFGLKKEYFYPVTDNPTQVVRFASGKADMTVNDYVGDAAGLPPEAKALERAIDDAADTARWVRGNGETLTSLRAEGFDPTGGQAADLAVAATAKGGDQLVLDLITAGLPLDRVYAPERPGVAAAPLGAILLVGAVDQGRPRVAQALIDRGWAAKTSRKALQAAFVGGAGGCDIRVARALVAAGIDPKYVSPETSADNYTAPTALAAVLTDSWRCQELGAQRLDYLRGLVALGDNGAAGGARGKTIFYGVESPAAVDMLLAAGVRPDVKGKDGLSPAFGSWTDEIVLRLLDAGADPSGEKDGKTLRQIAVEHQMRGTLAWLDARGVK